MYKSLIYASAHIVPVSQSGSPKQRYSTESVDSVDDYMRRRSSGSVACPSAVVRRVPSGFRNNKIDKGAGDFVPPKRRLLYPNGAAMLPVTREHLLVSVINGLQDILNQFT